MSELVLTPRFERAFRRLVGKDPALQAQIETSLRRLAEDANDPRLKTHHLSGHLKGLHASSFGYDCRIVSSDASGRRPLRNLLLHSETGGPYRGGVPGYLTE